ncbi:MAG TPA: CHRD domain-containing protein [Ramlibacter sp.]|jgi:hypothetical protein
MLHFPALLRAGFAAGALALGLGACAHREPVEQERFHAVLDGAQQVPAVSTAASGHAELHYTLRGQMLRWEIHHSSVNGPVTSGHIHGPGGPGQNADIVIPLSGRLENSPIRGQLRISPEQYEQLRSGQWYVDLHTARHPQGELRGQLRPAPL